jgi:hypothetical protein
MTARAVSSVHFSATRTARAMCDVRSPALIVSRMPVRREVTGAELIQNSDWLLKLVGCYDWVVLLKKCEEA